jgi:hypothetical protein
MPGAMRSGADGRFAYSARPIFLGEGGVSAALFRRASRRTRRLTRRRSEHGRERRRVLRRIGASDHWRGEYH